MPRAMRSPIAALVLVLATTTRDVARGGTMPMPVRDALGQIVPSLGAPIAVAPDGRLAVLAVQDPRQLATVGGSERFAQFGPTGTSIHGRANQLWSVELATGTGRYLTGGQGDNWGASWSPDGKTLAFYSDRDGAIRLWAWDAATGKQRRLAAAIVRPNFDFEVPRWTPDGGMLLVKLLPEGETLEAAASRVAGKPSHRRADQPGQPAGVTARVYLSPGPKQGQSEAEGGASLEMNRCDLTLVDVATGAVDRVARGVRTTGYWLSPDGEWVAYTEKLGDAGPATQNIVYDIRVLNRADRVSHTVARRVLSQWGTDVAWSPDGTRLAFGTSGDGIKGDCWVVDVAAGTPTNLTAGVEAPFGERSGSLGRGAIPPCWGADGQTLYSISRDHLWAIPTGGGVPTRITNEGASNILNILRRGHGQAWTTDEGRALVVTTRDGATKREGFARVELASGRSTPLLERDAKLGEFAVAADGSRLAFLSEDAAHPTDLWTAPGDLRDARQASHLNPHLERYPHGRSRLVEWRSLDGRPLRGALLLPADQAAGRRAPLVVHIYPGERRSDQVNTYGLIGAGVDNMQLLATRGYAVLVPDLPVNREMVPTDLLKMVLPGVERVVDLGIADSDRVGVMGHSFGGFGTVSLIVQTTRFRAAVACSGIGDLVSQYGQIAVDGFAYGVGWSEDSQIKLGGPPWTQARRYIEQSPVFHLDRVETPLLIINGALDEATPPGNMGEMFVGLRRLGKEAVFVVYDGEEHWAGAWGYANAVDFCDRIIAWFDSHIGPAAQPARAKTSLSQDVTP